MNHPEPCGIQICDAAWLLVSAVLNTWCITTFRLYVWRFPLLVVVSIMLCVTLWVFLLMSLVWYCMADSTKIIRQHVIWIGYVASTDTDQAVIILENWARQGLSETWVDIYFGMHVFLGCALSQLGALPQLQSTKQCVHVDWGIVKHLFRNLTVLWPVAEVLDVKTAYLACLVFVCRLITLEACTGRTCEDCLTPHLTLLSLFPLAAFLKQQSETASHVWVLMIYHLLDSNSMPTNKQFSVKHPNWYWNKLQAALVSSLCSSNQDQTFSKITVLFLDL